LCRNLKKPPTMAAQQNKFSLLISINIHKID
jgi:hypothetical protein